MGRPTSYELQDVLLASVTLFRAKGFQRVSVEELVQATGLNRFALYEKFGGKEGLFYETLDYYHEVLIRKQLLGRLFESDASLGTVVSMLGTARAIALDPELRSGCLIVNANTELGGTDERVAAAAATVMNSFRDAVTNALAQASSRGELRGGEPVPGRVSYVVVMIQAFFALAYISREAANEFLTRLIDQVQAWQQTSAPVVRLASRR